MGIRPPSFWNFCGSFRNSMISWSSSLASSTPETSLNVTFFCELEDNFARLLPNDRALFPALHLPHDEDPEPDHQEDGGPGIQDVGPGAGRGLAGLDLDAFSSRRFATCARARGAELGGITGHPVPLPCYLIAGDDDRVDLSFDFLDP